MKSNDWKIQSMYVSQGTWQRLKAIAARNGETLASLVRRVLEKVK